MGRGSRPSTPTTSKVAVPRARSLATNEARDRLYELINELASLNRASRWYLDRAVEVGPRGRGGALLLPTIDVEAMLARIEELEDEVEDLTLAQLVEERLQTPDDQLLSVEQLASELGRGHLLTENQ